MPRHCRHVLPDIPLHVIQRGNNRQACFFTKRDFIVYLGKLHEYSRKFDVAIHSYVLMTNHVHLLLTPRRADGPSQMLQALGRYYVRFINSTYSRTGTLWEGRFKASLVDSDAYFLTVSRYVELNPVRAGMVSHAADYPWSSFQMNAQGKKIELLTPHPVYQSLGPTAAERQRAYSKLFNEPIPAATLDEIRGAANKAWILGDSKFKQRIERLLGYELPPFGRGGDRRSEAFNAGGIKLL